MARGRLLALVILVSAATLSVVPSASGGVQIICGGAGDFDGDGSDDLTIGVPREASGPGSVVVLSGGDGGVAGAPSEDWSQGADGLAAGGEEQDFGSALASGDFNGDGFDDLAVGVPAPGYADNAGIHVIYGSASGLQADAPDDQFWTADSPGVVGSARTERFGMHVAAGDLNGDGYADLVGSDALARAGGEDSAGYVRVIYGSASGLQATGTGGPDDQRWTQDTPGTPGDGNSELGDWFGYGLEIGQFGRGAPCDLAIATPSEDHSGFADAGAVRVLYGTTLGLATGDTELWSPASVGVRGEPLRNAAFGSALAGGDYDGAGPEDLAIGAAGRGGSVHVLYARSTGGLSARDDQRWTQGSPGVPGRTERDDGFGAALTEGNFDGGAADDLAIGAPGETYDRVPYAGKVHVLYGRSDGLRAVRDDVFGQDLAALSTEPEHGDLFGLPLGFGNFRGGATDALVIGVPYESLQNQSAAGIVHVLYGSPDGGVHASGAVNVRADPPTGLDLFGAAV